MQIWQKKIKGIGIMLLLFLGITGLPGCQKSSSDTAQLEIQEESSGDALASAYEEGEEKGDAGQQEDYITPDDVTEQDGLSVAVQENTEETKEQSSNKNYQSKEQDSKTENKTASKRTNSKKNSSEKEEDSKKQDSRKQDTSRNDNRSVSNSDQLNDNESRNASSAEDKQTPASSKQDSDTQAESYCSFTIECKEVLTHKDKLKKNKQGLIPEKGIIYSNSNTVFYVGESVFDILLRETKNNKIQMEYNYTPAYQSNYIEGIANLYEFDCGEMSGWKYLVNGQSPNYGCNRCTVKAGDEIIWRYTCE